MGLPVEPAPAQPGQAPASEDAVKVLITSDAAGGVGVHAGVLARALQARGHEVTVVVFGAKCASQTHSTSGFTPLTWIDAPFGLEWQSQRESAALASETEAGQRFLTAVLHERSIELLHSNQFAWAGCGGLPALLAVHSDVVSWWRAVHHTAPPDNPFQRWYRGLALEALRRAAMVVAPTRAALADLRLSFNFEGGCVIPNGTDTPEMAGGARQGAISVGRLWDEGKQAHLLWDCDLPLPTIVAGDDGGRPLPRHPHLQTVGVLSPLEIRRLFSRSLLYVATSRYEPFGLAPLEAARAGCCLLLNDLPSFREIWHRSAYYFRRDDPADLQRQLCRLAADPALTAAGAAAAGLRARAYSAPVMAMAYETLYYQLLSRRNASVVKTHSAPPQVTATF